MMQQYLTKYVAGGACGKGRRQQVRCGGYVRDAEGSLLFKALADKVSHQSLL